MPKTKAKKSTASKRSNQKSSVIAETKNLGRKLDRDVKELEDEIYGLKELIHGLLIGLVIGVIMGVFIANVGF